MRRFLSAGFSRTFTNNIAICSGSPGVLIAFVLVTGTASALATLYNSTGSTSASTELATLSGGASQSLGYPMSEPIQFGACGMYLGIVGTAASVNVAWQK